jgi:23S rRNA (cytidine1920-2'-O)/16S rRNA (cytidine1409-2'-O)-methyltransferase
LKLVLPAAIALAARPADIVALIKPQFELTRADPKRGIVRDPELHRRVCEEIAGFAAALGLTAIVQCDSPITGADGNREFFIGGRLG